MDTYYELGSHYPELMKIRQGAMVEHPEKVYFMLEPSRAECMEYLHYIADFGCQRYPTVFEKINGGKGLLNKVTGRSWDDLDLVDEPLKVVGECIPDDIAIMSKLPTPAHPDDTTSYKYAASINCFSFPGEMMTSKIGLVMGGVHEPVPGFNQKILKPVNSWFDVLQSPSHRLNWWLQPDHRYFRPEFHAFASTETNASEVAEQKQMTIEDVYYRVERQSFIRLRKTKAIVFGVRLFVYPLLDVIAAVEAKEKAAGPPKGNYDDPDPDKRPLRPFIERLYSGVVTMGPRFREYKGQNQTNGVVQRWLEKNRGMTEASVDRSGVPV